MLTTGGTGSRAARRDARGDGRRARARGARASPRRSAPTRSRRRRTRCSRAGVAGVARPDARRQPPRLARRLPRRLRRAAAGARARPRAARRRARPRTARHDRDASRYPRASPSLVKIEHTVFALPFAYVGAFLAVDGVPSAHDLLWITVAMVGARSLAMALNRLIDAEHRRAQPAHGAAASSRGALSTGAGGRLLRRSLAVFLVAVWQLDPLVRWLWPIPVAGFVVYPYLKRFTWLCHLWLGAVDGLAPVGAWAAIRATCRGRRGRSAPPSRSGSPASTSSTRSSTSRSTGAQGCTRGRRASASAASSRARGSCTSHGRAARRRRARARRRRRLLARRRGRRRAARLRALARPARRPAPAGRCVLHDERRDQRAFFAFVLAGRRSHDPRARLAKRFGAKRVLARARPRA